ncbi:MAG TPA: hypothetical protein DDZ80_22065 [Cyanobacteria bacterium UBA8803]|nr:hypothetical protein [Cyanobacteria bacterium UBA9273]HBL61017.1 hypothetical protein [Cyanobacteria bacterium UBA8803]
MKLTIVIYISLCLLLISSNSPVIGIGAKQQATRKQRWQEKGVNFTPVPTPYSLLPTPQQKLANGQILQINGNVQIQRSERIIHPQTGTLIYPEDKLLTANGAQVLVQCADLSTHSISPGKNQTNSCPSATEQTECSPGTYKCPHRGNDIAWREGIPYIISPRRTAILTDKPILHWQPVPGAKLYTVSLKGEGVNWTTQVSDTRIVYPGEPPLQGGVHYTLIVEADTGVSSLDEPVRPGGLNFSVLDQPQAQRLCDQAAQIAQQPWNELAKTLALINLYGANDLHAEAIATLETLVATGTNLAPIYHQLGDRYFYYLGLIPPAKDYYLKAIALADPDDLEDQTQLQDSLGQVQVALGNKDEAVRWLTLALKGYQTLGDAQRARELENQLNQFSQNREQRTGNREGNN